MNPIAGTMVEMLNIPSFTDRGRGTPSIFSYPIMVRNAPVSPAAAACPIFLAKEYSAYIDPSSRTPFFISD